MDKKQIQDVKKKLIEINTLISDLDPAIRSAAFNVLAPLYFGDSGGSTVEEMPHKGAKQQLHVGQHPDAGTFFASFTHDKPNDNVHLIGSSPCRVHEIMPKMI